MRVGVEEALDEDLAVVELEQLAGDLRALHVGWCCAHRDALDFFEHEQPARRQLLEDTWSAQTGEVAERCAEPLDVLGLELEIELPAQRVGEVLDRGRDVDELPQRAAARGLLGEELE